ncbi:hypothetical protein [Variovorax sp.]|jgi:hypothetical protein|uniref:hypothetical protein n=1 Tax=Variovorax sp. TaxID=1871043 RepID=UPI0037DA5AB4
MSVIIVPTSIKDAMAKYITGAIERLDPTRYDQEPNYVAALLGKLDGVVYEGADGRFELKCTSVNGIGPNAAEKKFGADFALVAAVDYQGQTYEKAVLGQAKKGNSDELSLSESTRLEGQTSTMRTYSDHYLVLHTPRGLGETVTVRRSVPSNPENLHRPETLTDYLEAMLRCSHGDSRKGFTRSVANSKLPKLKAILRRK